MTRLLIVSSSRADVGILSPVWNGIAAGGKVETHVLLTGMHMSNDSFARSHLSEEIIVHKRGMDILGRDAATAAASMGNIVRDCASLYEEIAPEIVLVTGDRLDMFPSAMASTPFNIPLAHLHGGEVTLGAIDERLRHAITKLSHIHFAATPESAQRICQMGEEPWRIHVSGAPGLDTLQSVEVLDRPVLLRELGFHADINKPLRLVGLHPETNAANPLAPMEAVLASLETLPPAPTLFTAPNSDPGGQAMRNQIEAFAETRDWAIFEDTLGSTLYANALRHAAILIGNSSSGIIEAPLFSLPFLNVGTRQQGRLQGKNVRNCRNNAEDISRVILEILEQPRPNAEHGYSPYGDGHAAERITNVLESLPAREILLNKSFWSEGGQFNSPWSGTS